MGKISQCARSCPHLHRQCQGPGGAEHYSQTEHLCPAGFGTDWELGKKHVPAVPRKLASHWEGRVGAEMGVFGVVPWEWVLGEKHRDELQGKGLVAGHITLV